MIQRIQSIYLLIAAAAGFSMFALPFATTNQDVMASSLFSDAVYDLQDHIALMVLFAVASALGLASILLYKNRPLQMNLARIGIVANVVGFVLGIILFMQDISNLGTNEPSDGFGVYLPIIYLVFSILALRAIGKDENLVSSMDRLR